MRRGDSAALTALFSLVYDELRGVARKQRRAWHGDLTLGTTALVHEAYLKLAEQDRVLAESRAHFMGVAAKTMRHILCNYSQHRRRQKRGGDVVHVPLDEDADIFNLPGLSDEQTDLLESLDEALRKLELEDKRLSDVVECRFFGGLSIEDTATALDTSPATVKRQWALARAWLYREMKRQIPLGDS
jgi:RNA polymerase sigma factor (TIGR02999 family)